MNQQGMLLRPLVTSAARVGEYAKNQSEGKAAIETGASSMSPEEGIRKQPKKECKTAHELGLYL